MEGSWGERLRRSALRGGVGFVRRFWLAMLTVAVLAPLVVLGSSSPVSATGDPQSSSNVTDDANNLALCDFDGNGQSDLFERQSNGQWRIAYNGSDDWVEVKKSSVGFERLMFGDINGDNHCDVVFRQNNGMVRYSSMAEGRWTNLVRSSGDPAAMTLCDFDGNGKSDVFSRSDSTNQWSINYDASGAWTKTKKSAVGFDRLLFGEVTGDGRCDVVARHNDGMIHYSSKAEGRWTDMLELDGDPTALAICDFDGNGTGDLFYRDDAEQRWYIAYDGSGEWTRTKYSTVAFDRLMFSDVTGDGRCDVVFQRNNGTIRYSSHGEGTWTDLTETASPPPNPVDAPPVWDVESVVLIERVSPLDFEISWCCIAGFDLSERTNLFEVTLIDSSGTRSTNRAGLYIRGSDFRIDSDGRYRMSIDEFGPHALDPYEEYRVEIDAISEGGRTSEPLLFDPLILPGRVIVEREEVALLDAQGNIVSRQAAANLASSGGCLGVDAGTYPLCDKTGTIELSSQNPCMRLITRVKMDRWFFQDSFGEFTTEICRDGTQFDFVNPTRADCIDEKRFRSNDVWRAAFTHSGVPNDRVVGTYICAFGSHDVGLKGEGTFKEIANGGLSSDISLTGDRRIETMHDFDLNGNTVTWVAKFKV